MLALGRRYPDLTRRLPVVPIVAEPTPVGRLAGLEAELGRGSLWVKRDDLTARPLGGNKARKLELLLGAARRRGARTLITFGGTGSNHALATALHGRRHGFAVTAVLLPQPVDAHVRANVAALRAAGARAIHVPTRSHAVVGAVAVWLAALRRDGRRPYVIPPGGSSPLGCVGYVGAALELAEQVAAGELPAPGALYVAAGSNGTAAGLLAGLRLAGLPTRLVAVRVSDQLAVDASAIARLAGQALVLLHRLCPDVPAVTFRPADLELLDGYLGRGYGCATPAGDQAVRRFAEVEGLTLERIYTGKTAAAFLDAAGGARRGESLLYWHTYGGLAPRQREEQRA